MLINKNINKHINTYVNKNNQQHVKLNLYELEKHIKLTYNLDNSSYYLLNTNNSKIIRNELDFMYMIINIEKNNFTNIELISRLNGGFLKKVMGFIFKIFDPIVKPLQMIADAFMMIIRAIIYMALLIIWLIKFFIWFLTDFLFSIPLDIITLSKRIIYLVFDGLSASVTIIIRKIGNNLGSITISALSGVDNVPDESINETSESEYFRKTGQYQKCYRTSDGLIPFSVIMATILCPPIGVFMEYGLFGWFNILICALLTLCFYFPGLIYALILLYC